MLNRAAFTEQPLVVRQTAARRCQRALPGWHLPGGSGEVCAGPPKRRWTGWCECHGFVRCFAVGSARRSAFSAERESTAEYRGPST